MRDKTAVEFWNKIGNVKNVKSFAKAYLDYFDVDAAEEQKAEVAFTALCGDKIDQNFEKSFYSFAAAFGPLAKDNKDLALARVFKEFWDEKQNVVNLCFHNVDKDEAINLVGKKKFSYMFRYCCTDIGTITFSRVSEHDGQLVLAQGKLLNLNGKGWLCQEKEKMFANLNDYFTCRGAKGDGRLLYPIERILKPSEKSSGVFKTPYSKSFDDEKKNN